MAIQTASATGTREANPFRDGSDYYTTAGADLRLVVGGNLALDGAGPQSSTTEPDLLTAGTGPRILFMSTWLGARRRRSLVPLGARRVVPDRRAGEG